MGSRVDLVTLHDEMVRVGRFSCGLFTAMAGKKNQSSSMYFYALSQRKKTVFLGSNISLISRCDHMLALVVRVNRLRLFYREKLCNKILYSGIELICEFL